MDLIAEIRRDARLEGLGTRKLAERYRVGRETVRMALRNAQPPERKTPVRGSRKLGEFKMAIEVMLREDLTAPRKQRHTATRIFARLVDELDATDLSYSTVRDYVRARRPQILVEAGVSLSAAMVPQEHAPGAEAEVDFGELLVDLAGVRAKVYMFILVD